MTSLQTSSSRIITHVVRTRLMRTVFMGSPELMQLRASNKRLPISVLLELSVSVILPWNDSCRGVGLARSALDGQRRHWVRRGRGPCHADHCGGGRTWETFSIRPRSTTYQILWMAGGRRLARQCLEHHAQSSSCRPRTAELPDRITADKYDDDGTSSCLLITIGLSGHHSLRPEVYDGL